MSSLTILRDKRCEHRLLEALSGGWTMSYACRVSGMARHVVDEIRSQDRTFDLAVTGAILEGKDYKLDEAKRRAFHGYVKKEKALKDYEGNYTGEYDVEFAYSDTLALAILKADRPEEFNRAAIAPTTVIKHEVSGPDGGPVEVVTRVQPKDRAKAILALLAGADAAELNTILGG